MRSNSGHGKSNNNLRDPTMKDHEKSHDKGRTEINRSSDQSDDVGSRRSDR